MKQVFFIVCFLAFTVLFTSCATTNSAKENEVAGYNLKSKKEQMQNKILHNKNKILLATP
jgi:high-affinity K+ transport system ATPase subunit B